MLSMTTMKKPEKRGMLRSMVTHFGIRSRSTICQRGTLKRRDLSHPYTVIHSFFPPSLEDLISENWLKKSRTRTDSEYLKKKSRNGPCTDVGCIRLVQYFIGLGLPPQLPGFSSEPWTSSGVIFKKFFWNLVADDKENVAAVRQYMKDDFIPVR